MNIWINITVHNVGKNYKNALSTVSFYFHLIHLQLRKICDTNGLRCGRTMIMCCTMQYASAQPTQREIVSSKYCHHSQSPITVLCLYIFHYFSKIKSCYLKISILTSLIQDDTNRITIETLTTSWLPEGYKSWKMHWNDTEALELFFTVNVKIEL